jgi:hypothetical protein
MAVMGVLLCSMTASADSWPRTELPLKLPRDLVIEAVSVDQMKQPVVRRGSVSAPLARLALEAVYLSPQDNRVEVLLNTDYRQLPLANRFLFDLGFSELPRREESKNPCGPGRSLCFAGNSLRVEFSNDEDRITVYKKGQRVAVRTDKDCSHSILPVVEGSSVPCSFLSCNF